MQGKAQVLIVSNKAVVQRVSEEILSLPSHQEGLNSPFSPNHTEGITTTQHISLQLQMLAHLAWCSDDGTHCGDFDGLLSMVENPKLPEVIQIRREDLAQTFEPFLNSDDGIQDREWVLLSLLVGFHDLGKMNPEWAEKHFDTTNVSWLAHDYDSASLLRNNPALLDAYEVSAKERELIIELCRLHSVPGQFFFGEGNVAAYQPLVAEFPRALTLARFHGLIDVMSALNHGFVRPILASHAQLAELAKSAGDKLEAAFRELCEKHYEEDGAQELLGEVKVGPVTWRRLRLLMGKQVTACEVAEGISKTPAEFVEHFDRVTDGDHTWYGTYIANAFGSGMVKALEGRGADATSNLVKVIACIGSKMVHKASWAISALGPSFEVAKGRANATAILSTLSDANTLEQGLDILNSGESLTYQISGDAAELGLGKLAPVGS